MNLSRAQPRSSWALMFRMARSLCGMWARSSAPISSRSGATRSASLTSTPPMSASSSTGILSLFCSGTQFLFFHPLNPFPEPLLCTQILRVYQNTLSICFHLLFSIQQFLSDSFLVGFRSRLCSKCNFHSTFHILSIFQRLYCKIYCVTALIIGQHFL